MYSFNFVKDKTKIPKVTRHQTKGLYKILYLKVDIHDMAVTGLSECCNNFKQVLVGTSQTRTVHPAALKAIGKARSTPVTGPEWPVKVQTGVVGEPVNHHLMLFTYVLRNLLNLTSGALKIEPTTAVKH